MSRRRSCQREESSTKAEEISLNSEDPKMPLSDIHVFLTGANLWLAAAVEP
ncbi:MAG: hypothetical protein KDA60_03045 [Planctomycetales bacterium]|nr:hypothetical protein [Planctomycetales bacterium]